ncbi:NosD domain-containing protein [Undibacterium fentianense]|uniref:Periplasmic copper-binding protein NosD beta helix domain-containing protein n=1 Tax=Undibacterium fentianense TaxID=2828728 RepID=A0A941IF91_9BURK|nr:NosD domain-containing protein [Undibacterium fentianense]MBR7800461.1 hypothetical protein [Undibacterium fentianense]
MTILKRLRFLILMVFATLMYSGSASAACTPISSVPFAITAPGQYCVTNDLQSSGAAGIQISISTGNVTLDLNGFALKCTASQNAIMGTLTMFNVTVKNGTIRDCNYAVTLSNCTSCTVQDIRAINNAAGIQVSGFAARVEHNQIRNDNALAGNPAILVEATSSLIDNNHISGSNVGIMNRSKGNIIRGNTFGICNTAIRFDAGATYQNNLTQLCTTAFTGAGLASSVNAGGNF